MSSFYLQELNNYSYEKFDEFALQESNNFLQESNNFLQELDDSSQEFGNFSQEHDNFLQGFDFLQNPDNSLQEIDLSQEFDNLQKTDDYPQELGDYPKNSIILYKEKNRSFIYKIIKEGIYPMAPILKYTLAPNKYEIPDNYIVETTWGHKTNKQTIKSQINYISGTPTFYIYYGSNFKNYIVSNKSSSHAATLLHQRTTPNKKSTSSGILLFGLQLKKVSYSRKREKQIRMLRPIEIFTNSTLTKRAINFSKEIYTNFQSYTPQFYHPDDKPVLESIWYSVKWYTYEVDYSTKDSKRLKQKQESICQIQDEKHMSRNVYSIIVRKLLFLLIGSKER
ncbi:19188_t:CDS:2 [Racocetra persica]|uniref:19188_t:CDS:1 n=1 Tax=Racocetra persica TaxID=160502 RepID=A0ACA9MK06_9GLOM|nr:19188_t:CDS:2 [Racocetra persica]